MEHSKILKPDQIFLDVEASSKKDVFIKISNIAKELNFIKKPKKLVKSFYEREKEGPTGFGDGFAIPHARNNDISKPGIFFLRLKKDIEWETFDDKPIKIIIALIVPANKAADKHLELLSKIAQKIINPKVQQVLLNSNQKEEIISELAS